jgi:hypothetical protein
MAKAKNFWRPVGRISPEGKKRPKPVIRSMNFSSIVE